MSFSTYFPTLSNNHYEVLTLTTRTGSPIKEQLGDPQSRITRTETNICNIVYIVKRIALLEQNNGLRSYCIKKVSMNNKNKYLRSIQIKRKMPYIC